MTLANKLKSDLKDAMIGRDSLRVSVIRMALTSLHNKRIEKMADLSEPEEIEVLGKEARKRREAIEAYRSGQRADLADKEAAELKLIESYLPARLSSEELENLVRGIISEAGIADIKDAGRVMGLIMPRVKGRADGNAVREVVQRLLGGG